MEQWTKWPRRLNGADFFGVIQFTTVFAFAIVLITAFAHVWLIRIQSKNDLVRARGVRIKEWAAYYERFARGLKVWRNLLLHEPGFGSRSRSPRDKGRDVPDDLKDNEDERRTKAHYAWCSQSAPSAIAAATFRNFSIPASTFGDTLTLLNSQCAHCSEVQSTNMSLLRYFSWAIPSIGFLGTVFGISDALLGAGNVLSPSVTERQQVIQVMSLSLGRAFDTTLVALVLGLVAMWCHSRVSHGYEQLVQDSRGMVMDMFHRPYSKIEAPAAKDAT